MCTDFHNKFVSVLEKSEQNREIIFNLCIFYGICCNWIFYLSFNKKLQVTLEETKYTD